MKRRLSQQDDFLFYFCVKSNFMANHTSPRIGRRPVIIANYGQAATSVEQDVAAVVQDLPESKRGKVGLRYNFPLAGEEREGGYTADGYCYRITFAAGRLERSYDLVRSFLKEQGYGELPVPDNAEELRMFRLPPRLRHQLSLFDDNGYVHNPIKLLFPVSTGRRGELLLEIYNEAVSDHLLRFHRLK